MERGIAVSLITGRMVSSAMRFARELGLTGPVVGYQGGLIRAMPELDSRRLGKLLLHTPIQPDVAREIVRVDPWSMGSTRTSTTSSGSSSAPTTPAPTTTPRSWARGPSWSPTCSRPSPTRSRRCWRSGEPPVPVEAAPIARAHFAGRADVTISHPRFLEFIAPGVSKGRAVRWLARRLRIPLGATLAIGDQWNDLEMLAEVGHGTAMPSAPAEVRAVARYVAPPLEDEGSAQIIEQLVLAPPADVLAASRRLAAEADERRRLSA